jgi:hypothetical protein
MKNSKQFSVNLASHPLRNRKFFFLLFSTLVVLFLLVSFLAGKIFIEFRNESQKVRISIGKAEKLIRDVQRDEKKLSSRIDEAVKGNKSQVDLVNSIILKKSFSWIEFFSDLERSLPGSSYIVSLAPTLTDESKLLLKLRVACSSVDDLLKLIDNFGALKFNEIRIDGETRNNRGLLIAEISLSYERTL